MTYQEATELLEKYPYFAYAALMALPQAPDEKRKDELRRVVAVNIGDPIDIAEVLGLNSQSLADFYPDTLPPILSTFDTIDTFLTNYGEKESGNSHRVNSRTNAGHNASILDDLEAMPVAGAGDAPDNTANAIDMFLQNVPPPQPRRVKTETLPEPDESPALTESFARILIKNRNYSKALQIIQELNLKNPEKSIYFADQIRFLKKLIINQSRNVN
ncbi:MAG: hypothetical protein K2H35_04145 [Muribaculaceae bacterium]|nr:hypothetical protein [Muribaculaceae bacterium]